MLSKRFRSILFARYRRRRWRIQANQNLFFFNFIASRETEREREGKEKLRQKERGKYSSYELRHRFIVNRFHSTSEIFSFLAQRTRRNYSQRLMYIFSLLATTGSGADSSKLTCEFPSVQRQCFCPAIASTENGSENWERERESLNRQSIFFFPHCFVFYTSLAATYTIY